MTLMTKKSSKQRFNSTMVRLKVANTSQKQRPAGEFQFHNGSIKSVIADSVVYALRLVSIPQWFD